MNEQAYPTREQAERIATDRCPLKDCPACDIAHWCASDIMDPTSASQACGASMLAMHDALDAKQAEIDRLRAEVERLEAMANGMTAIARAETIRKEKKRSMREMAYRCGVSASTYSRWVAGKASPDMESMRRINYAMTCKEEQHGTI